MQTTRKRFLLVVNHSYQSDCFFFFNSALSYCPGFTHPTFLRTVIVRNIRILIVLRSYVRRFNYRQVVFKITNQHFYLIYDRPTRIPSKTETMSLQWTIIATFLYFEVGVLMLFLVPYMSAKRWNGLFKSRFYQALSSQAQWYFTFLLCILVLFLLDSIREMRKYSNPELNDAHQHLDHEMQANMRLFRAQRNFYISGIALFLSFVIKRFISLMTIQASLVAQSEASLKQATSASNAAKTLLAQQNSGDGESEELIKLKKELESIKTDRDAIKSQAESVTKEYDRLLIEHEKLQKTVGNESKKDD